MVELVGSATFDRWIGGRRDRRADVRIQVRIDRLAGGNPGDVKSFAARWKDCNMTEEAFSRYDTADYVKSERSIAFNMEAVMGEAGDDPVFVARALGTVTRAWNMSRLARDVGMSREGLYKALSGDGNPSVATVTRVVQALGMRLILQPAA